MFCHATGGGLLLFYFTFLSSPTTIGDPELDKNKRPAHRTYQPLALPPCILEMGRWLPQTGKDLPLPEMQ